MTEAGAGFRWGSTCRAGTEPWECWCMPIIPALGAGGRSTEFWAQCRLCLCNDSEVNLHCSADLSSNKRREKRWQVYLYARWHYHQCSGLGDKDSKPLDKNNSTPQGPRQMIQKLRVHLPVWFAQCCIWTQLNTELSLLLPVSSCKFFFCFIRKHIP